MSRPFEGVPTPYETPNRAAFRAECRAKFKQVFGSPDRALDLSEGKGYTNGGMLSVRRDLAAVGMLYPFYPGDHKRADCLKLEDVTLLDKIVYWEELSPYALGGVTPALTSTAIGLPPILKKLDTLPRWVRTDAVPRCLSGEAVWCLGITEPGGGSDVAGGLKTTAVRQGDFFVVNGQKKWITSAMYADYCTLAVRTGSDDKSGISLLLVDLKSAKGLTMKRLDTSGWWASHTTLMIFEDVKVPCENLVGDLHDGFKLVMENFSNERAIIAAQSNGISLLCLNEALEYGRRRKTFGKRLLDHQVLRHKLMYCYAALEASKQLLNAYAYGISIGNKDDVALNALCKVTATRTLEKVARETQQIMGGVSYTRMGAGRVIEAVSREVRVFAVGGGSEEILIDLSARASKI